MDKNSKEYFIAIKQALDEYRKEFGDNIYCKYFPPEVILKNNTRNISYDNEIKFMMDRFFNRFDVYPVFWQSKDKCGYSFACVNEWKEHLCAKKMGSSCSKCKNKQYKKLTQEVIYQHLYGNKPIGTYAINEDNKSKFLVFDFDEETWKEEIVTLHNIAKKNSLHSYIEVSKSGNGGHLWLFFNDFVSATTLRAMGKYLLFELMDEFASFSFSSFDRMFPNQNFITKDGLGNLIFLPFAHSFQNNGSYFVDENFNRIPLKEFMNNLIVNDVRINQQIIDKYKKTMEDDKFTLDSHQTINIIRSNELIFNINELDKSIKKYLRRISSFANPEFYVKERARLSTYLTPSYINCVSIKEDKLLVPRGLEETIIKKFKENKIDYTIKSDFNKPTKIEIEDSIELYPHQLISFNNLIKKDTGILVANTGFGKTIIGAKLISHYKVNTLILVNKNEIKTQWIKTISKFLNLRNEDISSDKTKISKINIRTIQSFLNSKNITEEMKSIGLIIVDECHHLASYTYETIVKAIKAKYVYGLSATPKRSDGLTKILNFRIGDCVPAIHNEIEIEKKLIVKETDFNIVTNEKLELNFYNQELIRDDVRNSLIVNDILEQYKQNNVILVIFEWTTHLDLIYEKLKCSNTNLIKMHGGMNKREYVLEKEKLSLKGPKIILATGSYIGEGFDIPEINCLLITFPFKWSEKLKQYIGRMRINETKQCLTIIDYFDKNIPYYFKMFTNRLSTYKQLGYHLENKQNFNKIIYANKDYETILQNEIINASIVYSNIDIEKILKFKNNDYVYKEIVQLDMKCIVLNNKVVWMFNNADIILRLENPYLIKEINKFVV